MSAEIVLIIRIIITVSIYIFLALTLWTLWRTTFSSQNKKEEIIPKIILINKTENLQHTFTNPEIYIGRDENANFRILDEAASNLHARLFWKENNLWAEDLNSTNGTFINSERMVAPIQISDEDLIQCGNTVIQVVLNNPQDILLAK